MGLFFEPCPPTNIIWVQNPVLTPYTHVVWVWKLVLFPCSKRFFFSGYSGFPVSSKTNMSNFKFNVEYTDCMLKWILKNSYMRFTDKQLQYAMNFMLYLPSLSKGSMFAYGTAVSLISTWYCPAAAAKWIGVLPEKSFPFTRLWQSGTSNMASQVETKPFCEFITKRTNIVVGQLFKKEIGLCLVYLTS